MWGLTHPAPAATRPRARSTQPPCKNCGREDKASRWCNCNGIINGICIRCRKKAHKCRCPPRRPWPPPRPVERPDRLMTGPPSGTATPCPAAPGVGRSQNPPSVPKEIEDTTRRPAWADCDEQLEAPHAPPRDGEQQRQRQRQQQMHAAQVVEERPLPALQTLLKEAAASAEAGEAERSQREKRAHPATAKRRRNAESGAEQKVGRRMGAAGSGGDSDRTGSDSGDRGTQPQDGLRAGGRERLAGGPGQAVTLLLALVSAPGHGCELLPPRNRTNYPTQIAGDRWGCVRAERCRSGAGRAPRDPQMVPPGRPCQRGGGSNPTGRVPTGQAARLGETTAVTGAGPSRSHREADDVPEGGAQGEAPRATRTPRGTTPGDGGSNRSAPCS